MVFADTAARKLLHGVAADAVGMSFGLDGLRPLIRRFFANLVATLASAAHELVPLSQKLWRWLQTAAANTLPVGIGPFAVLCLVALVWFCKPFLCAAAVGIGKVFVALVWFCKPFLCAAAVGIGQCLYAVALWVGGVLIGVLPGCGQCCCVGVTMNAHGTASMLISHAAFVAHPGLYFQIVRSAGGVVASAVFCMTTVASAVTAPVAALFRA